MKRIAETLGVARSNSIEREQLQAPQAYSSDPPHVELTADIRRLVSSPVNAERVYRLMKKYGLLLARHTGRRVPCAHEGTI